MKSIAIDKFQAIKQWHIEKIKRKTYFSIEKIKKREKGKKINSKKRIAFIQESI